MRNFTKFAAIGAFAAAICVGAAFNVASNGDNSVYSNRKPQKNEKAAGTVGKSNSLYVVEKNEVGGNCNGGRQRYGSCCSRNENRTQNNGSSSFDGNRQQSYSEYDCH